MSGAPRRGPVGPERVEHGRETGLDNIAQGCYYDASKLLRAGCANDHYSHTKGVHIHRLRPTRRPVAVPFFCWWLVFDNCACGATALWYNSAVLNAKGFPLWFGRLQGTPRTHRSNMRFVRQEYHTTSGNVKIFLDLASNHMRGGRTAAPFLLGQTEVRRERYTI